MMKNIEISKIMGVWESDKEGVFTNKKSNNRVDPFLRPEEIKNITVEVAKMYARIECLRDKLQNEYKSFIHDKGMPQNEMLDTLLSETITLYRNVTVEDENIWHWTEVLPFSTTRKLSFAEEWKKNHNAIVFVLKVPLNFSMFINELEDKQAEVLVMPSKLTITDKQEKIWHAEVTSLSLGDVHASFNESLTMSRQLTEENRTANADRLRDERQQNRNAGGDDWD